jgi:hypothetical protein
MKCRLGKSILELGKISLVGIGTKKLERLIDSRIASNLDV